MDTWFCFCILAVVNKRCFEHGCTNNSFRPCLQFFCAYTQVELLHQMVILCLFLRTHRTVFHSSCTILYSHQQCTRIPIFPHLCQNLFFFIVAILIGVRQYLIMVQMWVSLMTSDAEHLVMCLLAIRISSQKKCHFKSFAYFELGCQFVIELQEFFIYSGQQPLIRHRFTTIFSHSIGYLLTKITVSFDAQKFLMMMQSNLSIFTLCFVCSW